MLLEVSRTRGDDVAADASGIDLHRAVDLGADPRPWVERSGWHSRAACMGDETDAYFGYSERPSAAQLARCRSCPVRTECTVDGIRQNLDRTVADSPDEPGCCGRLEPAERWGVVQLVRAWAAELGVRLHEDAAVVGQRVAKHVREGRSAHRIVAEVNRHVKFVVDTIVVELSTRTWTNHRIAAVPEGRSYERGERRRLPLRAALGDGDQHVA